MRVDSILCPAQIDLLGERDLGDTVCVVFDVLRATSSMLTALAGGAKAIYPASTIEEALALKSKMPDAVLGGERFGEKIEGFDFGNSPLEYLEIGPKRIISTTTNGTVALKACEKAAQVIAGALLNAQAVADYLKAAKAAEVLLVCAGTFREPALEDMIAAGLVAELLGASSLSDGAYAARATWREHAQDVYGGIMSSQNGRVLMSRGREEEVRWCAQTSHLEVVAIMGSGALVAHVG